jgi:hypothetical protein
VNESTESVAARAKIVAWERAHPGVSFEDEVGRLMQLHYPHLVAPGTDDRPRPRLPESDE